MIFTTLGLSLVLAQPASWALQWQSASGCSSEADVKRAVEARLHRAVFSSEPKFIVVGEVDREGSGWRAHITLRDPAGVMLGTRDVVSQEPACISLDSRVTLVVALLIDPLASLRTPSVKQAEAPVLQPLSEPEREALRAALQAPAPGEIEVSFDGDDPNLELLRLVEGPESKGRARVDSGYVSVCRVPCSKLLPSADLYLVAGDGVRPSIAFHLLEQTAVRVQAKAGSLSSFTTAIVLATLGTMSLIGGSLGLYFAAKDTSANGPALVGLTLGSALVGLAGIVGGAALGSSTSTDVQVTPVKWFRADGRVRVEVDGRIHDTL